MCTYIHSDTCLDIYYPKKYYMRFEYKCRFRAAISSLENRITASYRLISIRLLQKGCLSQNIRYYTDIIHLTYVLYLPLAPDIFRCSTLTSRPEFIHRNEY